MLTLTTESIQHLNPGLRIEKSRNGAKTARYAWNEAIRLTTNVDAFATARSYYEGLLRTVTEQ